ncbi:hypothetical protein PIB30_014758 [Stylosanthes scabra]|uniref:Uncharacterized protein n=1 Tax=Stylosanthes scabra TaxID=79078 RepID=A0ABU6Y6Z2_9FABA|nr:hypothetical protein [Stylosanthes scabra]
MDPFVVSSLVLSHTVAAINLACPCCSSPALTIAASRLQFLRRRAPSCSGAILVWDGGTWIFDDTSPIQENTAGPSVKVGIEESEAGPSEPGPLPRAERMRKAPVWMKDYAA